jgi:putative ABC transport system substrate-binding protein
VIFIAVDFDPLAQGFVASLRSPGGNMTGVYLRQGAVAAKRLEIAQETLPGAKRFLVLADEYTQEQLDAVRRAAETARVTLTVVEFRKQPYDFAAAFETGRHAGVEAVIGLGSPVFAANLSKVSEFLARHRLPAIGSWYAAEAGFLLSYSGDHVKAGRRAADLGVRVLKGAKPPDTPVEQVDEFELVVNLKTARALGVKIPHAVLTRATRAIE